MTLIQRYHELHRAARLDRKRAICPSYGDDKTDLAADLKINFTFTNLPVRTYRYNGPTLAARRHHHITMAASARRRVETLPRGSFLRRIAVEDCKRNVEIATEYGKAIAAR